MSKRSQWKYLEKGGYYYRFSFDSQHLYDIKGEAIGGFKTICQLEFKPTTRAKFYAAQMEYYKACQSVWKYEGKVYGNGPQFEPTIGGERAYYNSPTMFRVKKGVTTKFWLIYYKGNLYLSSKKPGSIYVTLYDLYTNARKSTLIYHCAPIYEINPRGN